MTSEEDFPDLDLPDFIPEVHAESDVTAQADLPENRLTDETVSPENGHWFGWEQLHRHGADPAAPDLADGYDLPEMAVAGPRIAQDAPEAPDGYEAPEYTADALAGLPGDLETPPPPGRWFAWEGLTAPDGEDGTSAVGPSHRAGQRPGMPDLNAAASEGLTARDGGDPSPDLLRQILAALTQPPPAQPAPTLDVGHSSYED